MLPVCGLQVLDGVMASIMASMPCLLRVMDNVALLDMMLSLFSCVSGGWKEGHSIWE